MTDYLTMRKAAKFLDVSRHTLRDWMNKGLVPFSQPGGKRGWFAFSRVALMEWMQARALEASRLPAQRRKPPAAPVPIPPLPPEKQHSRLREAQRRLRQMAKAAEKAARKAAKKEVK